MHGPFTFALDGNPLVGPLPGKQNYWSACGVMAGFSQGGGVGLMLAQWMIEGKRNATQWQRKCRGLKIGLIGIHAAKGYRNYQKRFSVSYPNEELSSAQPLQTTPMNDNFNAMGAVWGAQYGLEIVNYFAQGD